MGTEDAAMPERVGRYEIVLPIAKGGMAMVYLARASGVGGFDRYMALKLTAQHLREDPAFAAHLIDEAKLVSHLRHTNVVPVYDVGDCEHGIFLVMEYVPGDSYAGIRRLAVKAETKLPKRVAMRILVDALTGLHAAHEQTDEDGVPLNLVHRDFTPQNILIGTDGIARLTDFGIAKAASRASSTGQGLIKGKLRYVSPEQARGQELDRRCDVWAAGVMAWEALTEKKLVHTDENEAVVIPKVDPPGIRSMDETLSLDLEEAIAGALRVDREQRTKTAQAFARQLAAAAKKADLFADTDEIAEIVGRLAGPQLDERKALLAEARRRRRDSAPDIREMVDTGRSLPPMRRALPSLPEMPVQPLPVPEPPGSTLGIEVELGENTPQDRASEGILGPAAQSLSPEEDDAPPRVYRSPVVAQTPVQRVLDFANDFLSSPWTPKKKIITGAAGGIAFLGLVLILVSALGGKGDGKAMASTTAGSASATANEPAGAASVAAAKPNTQPANVPATNNAEVDDDPTGMLHVKANAAIAKVALPDRVIDAVVPAPSVGIDLTEADEGKTLKVVVTSVDGRTAVATAEPGTRDLEVTFGDKGAVPATPAVRPTSATAGGKDKEKDKDKRTWQKRGPR